MLEGRKERAGKKRERETEENKKTAWRKEAKELGSPGQDDSSKERRRQQQWAGGNFCCLCPWHNRGPASFHTSIRNCIC